MTLAEVLLWKRISRRQLGIRFNRQKPIGKYIVDFYCKELPLAVEVDGDSHNLKKERDAERQQALENKGVRFLRFWDYEVKNDLASVIARIRRWIQENPPRPAATPPLEGTQGEPTPACGHPSHGGERERTLSWRESQKHPANTVKQSPPAEGCLKGGVGSDELPSCGGVPDLSSEALAKEERRGGSRTGAALVVVMWVLVIVAMIVSTFAFEMQLEARLISAQRKRFKADQLALAGVELAKAMLAFEEENPGEEIVYEDPYMNKAAKIAKGVPMNYSEMFGDGTVTVHIDYEKGRRNIRKLTRVEWKELFDQANIPNTRWDTLLDCLDDWQDENDEHHLNGAESDDPFYRERGYECKNAPVDTVDELLLIKEWDGEILYGTPSGGETEDSVTGIAGQLTTWGDGKVNPNSASGEVLYSLNIPESMIDDIMVAKLGPDGEEGTEDDGITPDDFAALGLDPGIFTLTPEYVAITSAGTVGEITSEISCIFKLGEKEASPLFWLEGGKNYE
jgi:very-short-patch-repair endonuclease